MGASQVSGVSLRYGGKLSTAVWVDVFAPQEVDETPEKKGLPVLGADGKMRPPWAERSKAMRSYYDEHWGNPQLTERELFATLSLLILQAGLFWGASLARREQLSAGLAGFDPDVLASFEAEDVEACLRNENLIRNEQKIMAIIQNAGATIALRESGGLAGLIWAHRPHITPRPVAFEDVPQTSPESEALANALREEGFTFVGPRITFALMQAAGVVDTNLLGTHKRGATGLWNEDGSRAKEVHV